MPISLFLKANVQRLWFYWKLYRLNSLSVPSGVANLLMPVDTIFCSPSICVSNPKKSKNIIFLPMGPRGHPEWCDATRSDAGVPEVPFSTKMTKMPLVNLGLTEGQMRSKPSQNNTFHSFALNLSFSEIFGNFDQLWPSWLPTGPRNHNFDLAVRTGWKQHHCEDYQILNPMTIHGSKSKLEQSKYHKNRDNALIDAPLTSESHNFWSDRWIFKFHTFSEMGSYVISRGVKINPIQDLLKAGPLPHKACWGYKKP